MKYTLIIGGAGFIGANLTRAFLKHNARVIIYSEIHDNNRNLDEINDQILVIQGKFNQVEKLAEIFKKYEIERIIHLVSGLIPSSNKEDFINEYNDVIIPTLELMKLMTKYNTKDLVYLSSGGTVYGNHKSNGVYVEIDKLEPINYYGLSKLHLEEVITFECKKNNLNYLILRPSNPFGRFQNIFGKQGLIPVVIGKVLNDEEIDIWGDGTIIRDYIPIDFLTNAIVQLSLLGFKNEVINVGSGIGYSVIDIVEMIERIACKTIKKNYLPNRSVDSDIVILNIEKLKSLMDIDKIDIEESIRNYFIHVKESFDEQ